MEELIRELEARQKTSEHDISAEFRKLIPNNKDEIPLELKAELMAFEFYENSKEDNNLWGTYFGPMCIFPNDDGTVFINPSMNNINKEIIDY